MIAGIGVDIVEIARIADSLQRFGADFLRHLYSEEEIAQYAGNRAEFHAGRFAAKEALAKALGCGFGSKCYFHEIHIGNDASGAPVMHLSGVTQATFAARADRIHLSITHEKSNAVAMVVLEKDQ